MLFDFKIKYFIERCKMKEIEIIFKLGKIMGFIVNYCLKISLISNFQFLKLNGVIMV